MKLADAWNHYYTHTGKASDVARQLALAGIAITWIFKIENGGKIYLPPWLAAAAIAIVLCLACDILQYITLAAKWHKFTLKEENKDTNPDREFTAPDDINCIGEVFFVLKLILVVLAYAMLAVYLGHTLDIAIGNDATKLIPSTISVTTSDVTINSPEVKVLAKTEPLIARPPSTLKLGPDSESSPTANQASNSTTQGTGKTNNGGPR